MVPLDNLPAEDHGPIQRSWGHEGVGAQNQRAGHAPGENVRLGDQSAGGQAEGPPRNTSPIASWGRGMTTRRTNSPAASASAAPAVAPASTSET